MKAFSLINLVVAQKMFSLGCWKLQLCGEELKTVVWYHLVQIGQVEDEKNVSEV